MFMATMSLDDFALFIVFLEQDHTIVCTALEICSFLQVIVRIVVGDPQNRDHSSSRS
jgi:hypothetical protein